MTQQPVGVKLERSGRVPILHLRRFLGRDRRTGKAPTRAVPPACVPLVEALLLGVDRVAAATSFVRARAEQGDALADCLTDVDYAFLAVTGAAAAHPVIRASATVWGDVTQGHYNGISCLDPLTGLASRQHFLTQLSAVYGSRRGSPSADRATLGHVLLVVDLATPPPSVSAAVTAIEGSVRELLAAEELRNAVPRLNTHARLRCCRSVALVGTDSFAAHAVDELATAIDLRLAPMADWGPTTVRWVELPERFGDARALVDHLGLGEEIRDAVPSRRTTGQE